MKYIGIETELGKVYVGEEDGEIILTTFDKGEVEESEEGSTEILEEAEKQILEYFKGKRKEFRLPLKLKGTDFQKRVWKALEEIPYGETRSYQEIAEAVHSPKAFRAVGNANNKNPISIILPCHRVIGKGGKLVGYGGGLDKKEFLLELERKFK